MATLPKPDNLNIFWSDEDNCFICQSNEYLDVIGIGKTESEAMQTYYELLDEYLLSIRKNKGGRPKKSNSKITYNISHDIKAFIELEALRNNVNQGIIIEKIVNFYKNANKEELSKYYTI